MNPEPPLTPPGPVPWDTVLGEWRTDPARRRKAERRREFVGVGAATVFFLGLIPFVVLLEPAGNLRNFSAGALLGLVVLFWVLVAVEDRSRKRYPSHCCVLTRSGIDYNAPTAPTDRAMDDSGGTLPWTRVGRVESSSPRPLRTSGLTRVDFYVPEYRMGSLPWFTSRRGLWGIRVAWLRSEDASALVHLANELRAGAPSSPGRSEGART